MRYLCLSVDSLRVMENKPRRFNPKILAIATILIILVFTGWLIWHRDQGKTTGWIQYTNSKYGLKFDYPKSWGLPLLTERSGQKGKHYELAFQTDAQRKLSITAAFDSKDAMDSGCAGGHCGTSTAYTKQDIQNELAKNKSSYVKYDDSSYATLSTDPTSKIAGELYFYQIINLKKVNSTAIQIAYTLGGEKKCPSKQLAGNDNASCITQTTYDQVNEFAKSIQSL